MHPVLRRTGRYVGWTLAALALLLVVALLALQTPWAKRYVLAEINEQANAAVAGELEFARLSGPLLWGATLHDLRLRDSRGEPVLRADETAIGYSPLVLLRDGFELSSVELRRPLLLVRRYPDGVWNLSAVTTDVDEAPEPDPDPVGYGLAIDDFSIEQGSLLYEDRLDAAADGAPPQSLHATVSQWIGTHFDEAAEVDFSAVESAFSDESNALRVAVVRDLELDSSFAWQPDGEASVGIDDSELSVRTNTFAESLPVAAEDLSVEYGPERYDLQIDALEVEDDSAVESLQANVDRGEASGRLERVGLEVDVLRVGPSLAQRVAPSVPLAVPVTFSGRASGPPEEVAVEASAKVPDGGAITIDATANLEAPSYHVNLEAPELEPHAWVSSELPDTQLDAAALIEGEGVDPATMQTRMRLTAVDGRIGEHRLDRLLFDARVDGSSEARWIELSELTVEAPNLSAGGSGRLGAGGDFAFDLRGDHAGVSLPDHQLDSANVEVTGRGNVALGPDKSFEDLASLSLDGDVGLRGLAGADLGVERVDATVDLDRSSRTAPVSIATDGTLADVEYAEYTAGSGDFDLGGTYTPAGEGDGAAGRLSLEGNVGGSGLEAPAWQFGEFGAHVSFDGPPMVAGEQIAYSIDGRAGGPRAWRLQADRLEFAADGTAVPAAEGADASVEALAAEGRVDLAAMRGFGLRTGSVETTFDLAGLAGTTHGQLDSVVEQLGVGNVEFGGMNLGLQLDEERNFQFATEAAPLVAPKLPFVARLGGSYDEQLSPVALETFEVGRPGLMWRMPDPGRVTVGGGEATLESVTLRGPGDPLDLSGTYQLDDLETFPQLVDRLGLSRLGTMFDPSTLRERLPDEYRDRLPDRLLEAPEDAARERLRDEAEKRLPDPDDLFDGF